MADDAVTMTQEEEAGAATKGSEAASVEPRVAVADGDLQPVPSVLQRLQTLPDVVRTYLLSDELAALHKKIFDEHKVSDDDRDVIYYTELQTYFSEIPLAEFPDRIW